jgi:ATP-dependent exoDNAse (exonuclease V) beta subunit
MMLIDELGIRQSLAARRGRAESMRRLDFVLERARAFVASTGGTIEQFLDFAEQEARGRARSQELIAASAEVDAVRIMTIHAAKGLEFPLVIVADLGANVITRTAAVLGGDAGVQFSLTKEVRSSGYEQARQSQLVLERAERVRLAYVGMTRARDYLVVMLRHEARAQPGLAEQIWSIAAGLSSWHAAPAVSIGDAAPPLDTAVGEESSEGGNRGVAPVLRSADDLLAWRVRRAELLATINRPRSVAPSSLGHGPAEVDLVLGGTPRTAPAARADLDGEDDEASPWRRARQASARGRAVHAVLQHASLREPSDLAALAELAASDEGIDAQAGVVERLARAALAAPTVQLALSSPQMMRELPLRVAIGDGAIEGIVDLCYLEEDGLVLVDYKTDALGSVADLAAAGARYHLQIGAYVLALERATGMAVRRAVLIFLAGESGALEYEVPDLPGAVETAREVVAATFRAPLVPRR